jgi:hypothetical protein
MGRCPFLSRQVCAKLGMLKSILQIKEKSLKSKLVKHDAAGKASQA